jgi:hypothetical protein
VVVCDVEGCVRDGADGVGRYDVMVPVADGGDERGGCGWVVEVKDVDCAASALVVDDEEACLGAWSG